MDENMILTLRDVYRYFGSLAAVHQMNLEVKRGEVLGIAGPNGSGKTTLINIITHTIPPSSGEIYFKGKAIQALKPFTICHLGIARTFQNPEVFRSLSVLDNLLLGAIHGMKGERGIGKIVQVRAILDFVGLMNKEHLTAKNLVISDKKKLMLAIALATKPALLILDEPCSGLTAIESTDMISLIGKINRQGITVMVVEHNMKVLMKISDRVMIMNHGVKVCEGAPDFVCNDEQVIEMYLGRKYRKGGGSSCSK
jgi:branched-chain amino acid transport system ATP-binding protein